jgi:hypothetical protein
MLEERDYSICQFHMKATIPRFDRTGWDYDVQSLCLRHYPGLQLRTQMKGERTLSEAT